MPGLVITVKAGRLELDKTQVRKVLRAAGNEIASVAKKLASKADGGGRMYAVKGSSGRGHYRASAPGQPPVRVSGQMIGTLKVRLSKDRETVVVRDGFPAKFLEGGAKGGGFQTGKYRINGKRKGKHRSGNRAPGGRVLLPRPFISVALEMRASSIEKRIAAAINDGLKFQRQKA
jgi:hypothetical protein